VVFNALLLDPWLFDLHLGAHALVQKARRAGRPLRGGTLSGGVPEVARGLGACGFVPTAGRCCMSLATAHARRSRCSVSMRRAVRRA
jgi:hypothetical protein